MYIICLINHFFDLFLPKSYGFKIVALHDLVYENNILDSFFEYLNDNYTLINTNNLSNVKEGIIFSADDGYDDWISLLAYAEKYDFHVFACISTGIISDFNNNLLINDIFHNKFHRTKASVKPISKGTLEALISSERITFVDHSYLHLNFSKVTEEEAILDLKKSINVWRKYDIEVKTFCLPYGKAENLPNFDLTKILYALGYSKFLSFEPTGIHECWLPRTGLDPSMPGYEINFRIHRTWSIDKKNVYELF